mmetsp:Transcript_53272/g.129423  ORF Transcript_53272/g.129423 Transcript_53272/m.129423 type:complete len:804 (-) Transcript_53272:241-2652(-)
MMRHDTNRKSNRQPTSAFLRRRRGGGGDGSVRRRWNVVSIFVRFVGCLVVMDGIALIIFYKPEWIVKFLNGPPSRSDFTGSDGSKSTGNSAPWKIVNNKNSDSADSSNSNQHPDPVLLGAQQSSAGQRSSSRNHIFRALTQSEKWDLKTMTKSFKGLQSQQSQLSLSRSFLDGMFVSSSSKSNKTMTPCRLGLAGGCIDSVTGSDLDGTGVSTIELILGSIIQRLRRQLSSKRLLLLRNSLEIDRYWCGRKILGGGGTLEVTPEMIETDPECHRNAISTYVYTNGPPNVKWGGTMDGAPPVELYWNFDETYGQASLEDFKPCSVPCRSTGSFEILNRINVKNTNWEITLTMEGEKYYTQAHVDALAYRQDRFYATTSFQSDIPVPYYSRAEYNIRNPPVDWDNAIKGASFVANNCASLSNREEIVRELIESPLRVDSLSGCLHNAEPPKGVDMNNKTTVMRQYLFHLAFENQNENDYITEKLWGSLEAGTLPVYYGAPNVKDHVPQNSIIVVDDFDSVTDLAEYLVRLTMDKALYNSYHRWRTDSTMISAFRNKYHFTDIHSTCRMCRWASSKRSGLGWNHSLQDATEPYISHTTCRNRAGLVGHPFKEYWLSDHDQQSREVSVKSEETTKTCQLTDTNRAIEIDNGNLTRRIYNQDGISDLFVDFAPSTTTSMDNSERTNNKNSVQRYFLKIETPIVASHFSGNQTHLEARRNIKGSVHWLQDRQSRMTILTVPEIPISMIDQGVVQFEVPVEALSDTVRIRVVTEDIDHFHTNAKKEESYFGNLMKRDFFTPIDAYVIVDG